jgi:NAD(P)-dependent dehydrogenase (short-subunit alcohol dehydrogenase family)
MAVAYSASKVVPAQLARVAALEWSADGIPVLMIHPNAVLDTAIWKEGVFAARAKYYGLTVEQYKKSNIFKIEVPSVDVVKMAAEMCGPPFARTTSSQVPVDGGNERVI